MRHPKAPPPMWLLVALACTGTLAMHMFVPALPFAAAELQVGAAEIQLSIGVYVFGLAAAQLVYGPVSDALGRRPVTLAGIAIFVAGSLACALAPTLWALLAGRLLQAIGGAGGLTLARAVVRDLAGPGGSQRSISLLNLIMLLGPAISPVLGAWVVVGLGWRAIFLTLALAALGVLAATLRRLPETAPQRRPLDLGRIPRDLGALLRHRSFACIATGGALGSTANYAYLASAPYILTGQLGVAPVHVGWFVGGILVGALAGTWVSRWRVGRMSQAAFLMLGAGIAVAATLGFLLMALTGTLTPLRLFAATLVMMFAAGAVSATALAASLDAVPERAGAAAGFFGAAQMALGGLCTVLVGLWPRHDLGCGLVLFGAALVSLALLRAGRVRG